MPYFPLPGFPGQYFSYNPGFLEPQGCVDTNACKLKVEGKGIIEVEPDIAEVILGAATEDLQLKSAQEENTRIINSIIDSLERMGIRPSDIQTQTYTIEPQYDFVEGKQVFRGYRVLHTLRVTIRDVGRIGEIIDEAVASGANVVSNISFTVSDPAKYYQQALNAAVDDALTKAGTIGRKLNLYVNQIPVQITEESYQYGTPIIAALPQAAMTATPIKTGQIEITARIEVTFTYLPR